MYPAELKYTKDHEWIRADGNEFVVGITDFAQRQLGDVVFVDLPDPGRVIRQGEAFGTIESVKAVSELFAPISGEVVATNPDLATHPESVNGRPHETWMIRLRATDPAELEALLDASAYSAVVAS
ncbi:MAG: glycine cleavage system protein GcvH [Acidobacteria bacterium]|nr:glycine cleavage system protein GcvH [Acidobacteriota bacterium]